MAAGRGVARKTGPASGAIRRRFGDLGLHEGPGGLPSARGHGRDPEAAQIGEGGERARPGLPVEPEALTSKATRLLQPGRSERSGPLRGQRPEWMAETPGATAWLKATEPGTNSSKVPTPVSRGPTPAVKQELQQLAQVFDVWQADFRQTPQSIRIGGEPVRPWVVLITSRSDDLVLAHRVIVEPPSSDKLWDVLAAAMSRPAAGESHRPTELQVRSDERWDELKPHLDEIGITVVATEELDHLDVVFSEMARHIAGAVHPARLEMPGVKHDQVASFYRAAAGFYRRSPGASWATSRRSKSSVTGSRAARGTAC